MVIKTPVEVVYWITIKKPYQITETCIKKVAKDIWKKPWKLVTVWVDVPYQCTRTIYKDVKEKRFKTEFKEKVVTKVERTVKKIEEYKRPAAYLACLAEKAVHDRRDFTIELMTGEDPDEVQAEIKKMFSECQARTAELEKLEKYLRAEESFGRNGRYFEEYMGPVAALATKVGGLYGAAAQERKMAVNRNKILSKIDTLQIQIDSETEEVALESKRILEEYLDRKITDKEYLELVVEHQQLVQALLDNLDVLIKNIVKEIMYFREILFNPELLLSYEEEKK